MEIIVKKIDLNEEVVLSIIDGALVGINDWVESMYIESYGALDKNKLDEELSCSELYTKVLMNGGKIKIIVLNSDDVYEPKTLTLHKLIKGIKYMYKHYPKLIDLEDLGGMDAFAYADIIQAAIFNDIIYG